MSNLQHRQSIIQEKRKKTLWRDFVMEIASWQQFNFYKDVHWISRYPITKRINKLVTADDFFSINEWIYVEYDLNISFFENYKLLRNEISLPYLWQFWSWNENSEYADTIYNSKNCYLSVSTAFDVQNILYSLECHGNLDTVISSVWVHSNSTNIYQCAWVADSYNVLYSYNIQNSSSIRFSSNLTGCSFCLLCDSLMNQSYCIKNKQYTKEEYFVHVNIVN